MENKIYKNSILEALKFKEQRDLLKKYIDDLIERYEVNNIFVSCAGNRVVENKNGYFVSDGNKYLSVSSAVNSGQPVIRIVNNNCCECGVVYDSFDEAAVARGAFNIAANEYCL